jgi:hypothetical protein
MANIVYSPREHFLSNVSEFELDIPLHTQWILRIIPQNSLVSFFNEIKKYIAVDHTQLSYATKYEYIEKFLGPKTNSQRDGLGLFFAQSLDIPEESLELEVPAMAGDNGFLQGNLIKKRASGGSRQLTMTLLETNVDIVDGLIKPWLIACGYRGNCEMPYAPNLKADIEIVQYAKGGGLEKPARKMHHFMGCTPFTCDGSSLQYDSEKVVAKKISWVYNYYHYKLI